MSIPFLDTIESYILVPIIEGKDVSDVIMVNADPFLHRNFYKNKVNFRTAEKKLDLHDSEGRKFDEIDLAEVDLSPLLASIAELESKHAEHDDLLQDNQDSINTIIQNLEALNAELAATNSLVNIADGKASEALSASQSNSGDINTITTSLSSTDSTVSQLSDRVDAIPEDVSEYAQKIEDNKTAIDDNVAETSHVKDIATGAAAAAGTATALTTANSALLAKHTLKLNTTSAKLAVTTATAASAEAMTVELQTQNLQQAEEIALLDEAVGRNTQKLDTFVDNTEQVDLLEINVRNNSTRIEENRTLTLQLEGEVNAFEQTVEAIEPKVYRNEEVSLANQADITEAAAAIEGLESSVATNTSGLATVQTTLALEGEAGALLRYGSDINVNEIIAEGGIFAEGSISSDGNFWMEDSWTDIDADTFANLSPVVVDNEGKPQPVNGQYRYSGRDNQGNYYTLMTLDPDKFDLFKKPIHNAESIGFNEAQTSSSADASYVKFSTANLELGSKGVMYFSLDGVRQIEITSNRIDMSGANFVTAKNSAEENRADFELINWGTLKDEVVAVIEAHAVTLSDLQSAQTEQNTTIDTLLQNIEQLNQELSTTNSLINIVDAKVDETISNTNQNSETLDAHSVELSELSQKVDLIPDDVSEFAQEIADNTALAQKAVDDAAAAQQMADDAKSHATRNSVGIGTNTALGVATSAAVAANKAQLVAQKEQIRLGQLESARVKAQAEAAEIEALTATNRADNAIDLAAEAIEAGQANERDLTQLNTRVNGLDGTVAQHTTDIGTLNSVTATHTAQIETLQAFDLENSLQRGTDIEVASVTSEGSFFSTDLNIPDDTAFSTTDSAYRFHVDNNLVFTFGSQTIDALGLRLTGLAAPQGDNDAVRKVELDPVTAQTETNRQGIVALNSTVDNNTNRIGAVETKANTNEQSLTSVNQQLDNHGAALASLETNALLQGTHADVDSTKFSVRNKPIKDIVDGVDQSDAVSKKQLDAVEAKADTNTAQITSTNQEITSVSSVANEAKATADANKATLDSLNIPSDLVAQVNTNTDEIALRYKEGENLTANAITYNNNLTSTSNTHHFKDGSGNDLAQIYRNHFKVENSNSDKHDLVLAIDPNNNNSTIEYVGQLFLQSFSKTDSAKMRVMHIEDDGHIKADIGVRSHSYGNLQTKAATSTTSHARYIDFSDDGVAKVGAKASIDFSINGNDSLKLLDDDTQINTGTVTLGDTSTFQVGVNEVMELSATGSKFLRDVNLNRQSLVDVGDINVQSNYIIQGASTGNLKIRNFHGFYKNNSTDNNSFQIGADEFIHQTQTHTLKNNAGTALLTVNSTEINAHDLPIKSVADATADSDAVNLAQVNSLLDGFGTGLKFESYFFKTSDSGMTVFEADYPNPLIEYENASYSGSLNFVLSNSGQSCVCAVRTSLNSGKDAKITVNFEQNADQKIDRISVMPGYMFIAVFNADLQKSYYTITPFKNPTPGAFALTDEIELENVAPDTLFFTLDQGVVESYLDNGEMKIRQLQGYNVPQQQADIQTLQAEAEANRVITHFFKNESSVTVPFSQEHPVVEVHVLDTKQTLEGTNLTLLDTETGKFSGIYNAVGSLSIYSNVWTTYSYHNAYKHSSQNYYVVFNQDIMSWVLLDTETLHNYVFEDVGVDQTSLNHRGQLPQSYENYDISMSIDNINSLEFIKAEANTRIDMNNKIVLVDFGDSQPSGKVVIR